MDMYASIWISHVSDLHIYFLKNRPTDVEVLAVEERVARGCPNDTCVWRRMYPKFQALDAGGRQPISFRGPQQPRRASHTQGRWKVVPRMLHDDE